MIVTLDGTAGVGKSSVARAIAKALEITYIDTGAMFRGVALAAQRRHVDWRDADAMAALLPKIQLTFDRVDGANHLFLNGEDVESLIRSPEMSQGASAVGVLPAVRTFLLGLQRGMAQSGSVVLEGRDTGTVVFPNADHKFYLEASAEVRAKRRWSQLQEKGQPSPSVDELKAQIEARDKQDTERDIAPLCCAEDAVRVDTSHRTLDEVIDHILQTIRERSARAT
ncbi:MAG: (d)CMP kinase [Deltaproteobacteria bacterium]|nr:MAG: (d)CMP kinase [Deltaproteobacteria bacterium]